MSSVGRCNEVSHDVGTSIGCDGTCVTNLVRKEPRKEGCVGLEGLQKVM